MVRRTLLSAGVHVAAPPLAAIGQPVVPAVCSTGKRQRRPGRKAASLASGSSRATPHGLWLPNTTAGLDDANAHA
ncbi:hypothetical protein J1614_008134 [Plenodomus biglobosus]|nr:hypothetical protein J1614_008134 [Plenodomus biglobosus]